MGLVHETPELPELGELLRRCRLAAGLTQLSLAEHAGISLRTVQNLEAGTTIPYRPTMARIVKVLEPEPDTRARLEAATARPPRRQVVPANPPASLPASLPDGARPVAIIPPSSPAPELGPALPPVRSPSGEFAGGRRQVTVLFGEIVGGSDLSQTLDQEEIDELVDEALQAMREAVGRFGGTVSEVLGDAFMAVFGAPLALEDHAIRACRAALAISEAARSHGQTDRLATSGLRARVGLDSGEVIVRDASDVRRTPLSARGPAVDGAAQLVRLAGDGTSLLTANTLRRVTGLVKARPVGSITVGRSETSVEVFELDGIEPVGTGQRVLAARPLTRFVGRSAELAALERALTRAADGRGQAVILMAEPGFGKSRLVRELVHSPRVEGWHILECGAVSYEATSPFAPLIDVLRNYLGFAAHADAGATFDALREKVLGLDPALEPILPALGALLGVEDAVDDGSEGLAWTMMAPALRRQRTLEAVVDLLLSLSQASPVGGLILVVEDLHWADPSTLELLGRLIDEVATARLLLLLTSRPEFQLPWPLHSYVSILTLDRFSGPEVEVLIERVVQGTRLPTDLVKHVVDKADGVPLFVEELVKMILESGLVREEADRYVLTGPISQLAIPSTLQDSLMARLDRLSPVHEIAQLGASIGREFTYELMQAVAPWDETYLQRGLGQLVEAELLYRRGLPPRATYLFKHALIQDAASRSLLRSRRQQYHRRIADVLVARFPDLAAAQPGLVAHHYAEAGLAEEALPHCQRAVQQAIERSAYVEAVTHLSRGLELLNALPEGLVRNQCELELQIALGLANTATRGLGAAEVEQAYTRALVLCEQMGEPPELFMVLWGLWRVHVQRVALQTARQYGERLLALAQRRSDPALMLVSHLALGAPLYFLGEFDAARAHLEQGLTFSDPDSRRALAISHGIAPEIQCLVYSAPVLWSLGYPDQALRSAQQACSLARELAHPQSLVLALYWTAVIHQRRGEAEAAYEMSDACLRLATEHEFALFVAQGQFQRGWALAALDRSDVGLAQMRDGVAAQLATGTKVGVSAYSSLLAETYAQLGQIDEARVVLAAALATLDESEQRYYKAEMFRLDGELDILRPEPAYGRAEARLQQALEVARRQHARSWELRAAISLARLWQRQGRRREARELLSAVYGWFTEGFETADLRAASALLEELQAPDGSVYRPVGPTA